MFSRLLLFSVTLLSLATAIASAVPAYLTFPSDIPWSTQSSPHFQVIFREGQERFGERALLAAERAHKLLTPIFPEAPEKTYLVLADFQDSTNGYALTFPYPHIVVFAAPPDAPGQLSSLDDWLSSVILHEYVHILHLYPANGFWGVLRAIFGSIISPNGLAPSHFHEGLAVMLETEKSDGGRGRSATFNMYRRMAVEEKVWGTTAFLSIDQMDGSPPVWPQGASPYFFGYHLYNELWQRKGKQGIHDLILDYSSNLPFFLNVPAEHVYDERYPQIWKEIFAKTTAETLKENARIKSEGLSDLKYLTQTRQGKWDMAISPDKKQIAYRQWSPENGPSIEIASLPELKKIHSITTSGGSEGICWVARGENEPADLFFVDGQNKNQYALHVLHRLKLKDKSNDRLRAEGNPLTHIQSLACAADGKRVAVYQEQGGKGFIREFGMGEESGHQLREWRLPESTWIGGLQYAGHSLRIFVRRGMVTESYWWPGNEAPKAIGTLKGHLFHPRPGSDDNETVAIADFEGRNEIWKLDWSKQEAVKIVSLLGGASSFDGGKEGLYLTSYRHGGFDLAITETQAKAATKFARHRRHPIPRPLAKAKQQRRPQEESAPEREIGAEGITLSPVESYSPFGSLIPRTWVPSLLFVPDGVQFGFFVPSFDLSQRHFIQVFGGYDTRGLPFGDFSYTYRFGTGTTLSVGAYYLPNYLVFSKTFFKRWGGSVLVGWAPHPDLPSLSVGPVFRQLEESVFNPQNRSVGMQVGLNYRIGFKSRPLVIAPTRGTTLGVTWTQYLTSLGSTDNYYSAVGALEQYLEAPWWDGHILYASAKMGITEGTFFLNNYFDGGGEVLFSQGRGTFLNRGFLPGSFLGRRMFNANFEYRFPIATIYRGLELLPIYLKRLYGSLVADTLSSDRDIATLAQINFLSSFFYSAGAELRSDWQFGFYLPTHVRLGAYHGFGPFGETAYFVLGVEASL